MLNTDGLLYSFETMVASAKGFSAFVFTLLSEVPLDIENALQHVRLSDFYFIFRNLSLLLSL